MSNKNNNDKKGAYEAFQAVDTLVSKPIFGSDGAASWQEFQKDQKVMVVESVAPQLPRKRNDIFSSVKEERSNEIQIRKETNQPIMGSGYTSFKKKRGNNDDANTKKQQKMIEQRIRPDDQIYFISSSTFTGWKKDYIFTTRDGRGTGYYWDGMDSLKEQQQKQQTSTIETETVRNTIHPPIQKKKKKKKKKEKKSNGRNSDDYQQQKSMDSIINPMDQVKNAIQQRQESQQHSVYNDTSNNGSLLSDNGWKEATDPTTKKTYYYQSSTGKRQWEKPTSEEHLQQQDGVKMNNTIRMNIQSIELAALTGKKVPARQKNDNDWEEIKDAKTQKIYYYQKSTGKRQWENPKLPKLPDGWKSIVDIHSGKTYYYHEQTKQTSWEHPVLKTKT